MDAEINIFIVFTILFTHFLGDFILQTDWEARNKSTNNVALTMHTSKYSLVWLVPCFITFVRDYSALDAVIKTIIFCVMTFICHTVTDYYTSRLNKKLWRANRTHDFFVSVGFDQILHYVQLLITFKLLL